LETKDEEFLFFHTNYSDKMTVLVVEIVVVRQGSNGEKSQSAAGFAVCPIFEMGQINTAIV